MTWSSHHTLLKLVVFMLMLRTYRHGSLQWTLTCYMVITSHLIVHGWYSLHSFRSVDRDTAGREEEEGFVQGTIAVSAAQESFNARGVVVSDDARTTSNFSMMLTNFVMSDREACRTT